MAIAQVPGKPRQRRKIGRANLDQRLRLGDHLDHAATVEQQRVIGAQSHRVRKIELDTSAFDAEQEALLRPALGMRKNERVDHGDILPFGNTKNASGAGHI